MDDRAPIKRRRFLTDLLFVGGGLLASVAWGVLSWGRDRRPPPEEREHVTPSGTPVPPSPSPSPSPRPRRTRPRETDHQTCEGIVNYSP